MVIRDHEFGTVGIIAKAAIAGTIKLDLIQIPFKMHAKRYGGKNMYTYM